MLGELPRVVRNTSSSSHSPIQRRKRHIRVVLVCRVQRIVEHIHIATFLLRWSSALLVRCQLSLDLLNGGQAGLEFLG